jgi:hypothetical protein
MTSCPPTTFCPDHPDVVTGAGLAAAAVFTVLGLVLLAVLVLRSVRALARRITRTRHTPHAQPVDGPPGHLTVIAAALDGYHLVADPAERFDGMAAAEHVHMYLASSGYRITPALSTLTRAYTRLRSARAIAGARVRARQERVRTALQQGPTPTGDDRV